MNKEALLNIIASAIAAGATADPTTEAPPPKDGTPEGSGPCEGCDCGMAESSFDEALASELNDLDGVDLETVINVLASALMSTAKANDMPHTAAAAFQIWLNNKD